MKTEKNAWLWAAVPVAIAVVMLATAKVPHAAHYAYTVLPVQAKMAIDFSKPVTNYLAKQLGIDDIK